MKDIATAFAPATVSNVGCGFDVLGFALEGPGDEVTARRIAGGVRIDDIQGDGGRLPREAERNTAGIAARALLARLFPSGDGPGVALSIRKGLPLASGLGGSAASAAAAVVAVDALVGGRAPVDVLIACALEGERDGAGSAHPDNVTPAVCGGFVLVRQMTPLEFVELPVPPGLTAVVVHPALEIETAKARELLGTSVPIADAVRQAANLGALVHALHRSDFDWLSRSLVDAIAEPRRAGLVPGLDEIKAAARRAGALGAGLSGSGPSLFALCRDRAAADAVAAAMRDEVAVRIGGACDVYVSPVAAPGARVVLPCGS
jgi:homoserine kinase